MLRNVVRLNAVTALVLLGTVAVVAPAQAAAAAWTKITTPGHTFTYHFDSSPGAVNQLTVTGQTQPDMTSVDIDCMFVTETGFAATPLATGVPVQNGSFNTVATVPGALGICQLRALPTGLVLSAGVYLGAFSGPIMYSYTFGTVGGATTTAFGATDAHGSGIVGIADASECAVIAMVTRLAPNAEQRGPGTPMCMLGLHPTNFTNTGTSTASAVRVDGKNAYLPGSVANYLRDPGHLGLALTQPAITTTYSRNATTGELKVTESERLMRCNGDNTFPPTSVSCSSLVNTGVTFKRAFDVVQGDHQVLIHDSYVSNDGHAHTVTSQYQSVVAPANYGAPGFIYPHHSGSFQEATADQVVTGFGTGAATLFARSDLYASSSDAQADTQALTWTRPPAKIQFEHTSYFTFAMPYTFSVPAGGSAKIGFAVSEAPLTSDAKTLAAKAVAAL